MYYGEYAGRKMYVVRDADGKCQDGQSVNARAFLMSDPLSTFHFSFSTLIGVDPEPAVANPVDAHDTNAEWYRIVCSNVFEVVDGEIGFREGVNSNAYYFVEVVASKGPAPIWFAADRDSRLGSPVVVATAGATNRVPLLIGVEYAVTSSVPITVTCPADGWATVVTNGAGGGSVKWPLEFDFAEHVGTAERTYTVGVGPRDPGGEFVWDGGAGCGCCSCAGSVVAFSCSASCGCGGGCAAAGAYVFEAAAFAVTGGVCRCGFDDPDPNPNPPPGPYSGPDLAINFSKSAVVFEDAYENEPGVLHPKRSTRVRLSVWAYGGTSGGTLVLASANLGKLTPIGVENTDLPSSKVLQPGEFFERTAIYEAREASDAENDISVAGYLFPNDSENVIVGDAEMTSVRVQVSPDIIWPEELPMRHVFGVCESANFYVMPSSLGSYLWEVPEGMTEDVTRQNVTRCNYLLEEGDCPVLFRFSGVTFTVSTYCVEPHDVVCLRRPTRLLYSAVRPGMAGGIGMRLPLTVLPNTVSFHGIRFKESATEGGVATGYFHNEDFSSWWNHDASQGAEIVTTARLGNTFEDRAEFRDVCPELNTGGWSHGSIGWTIPCRWREKTGFFMSTGWRDFTVKQQTFTIDPNGTVSVEKFGWRAVRAPWGYSSIEEVDQ